MVQLLALPEAQRTPVWRAILAAPGSSTDTYTLEQAIGYQINCLDRLNAGEDLALVPTYGRPPAATNLVVQRD
jgi:hypothetical protein